MENNSELIVKAFQILISVIREARYISSDNIAQLAELSQIHTWGLTIWVLLASETGPFCIGFWGFILQYLCIHTTDSLYFYKPTPW